MKKPKQLKPRPEFMGGYSTDGAFFKMTHKEFYEYVGGVLAVALFKGGDAFRNETWNTLNMATARGMLRQWELANGYE